MKNKKRVIALMIVLVLSLSCAAFAGSASKTGTTSGGTSGILNCSASLTVDRDKGTATTSAAGGTINTSIIYYYTNSAGQEQASSSSGSNSATAGNSLSKGTRATSSHSVNGGSAWGSWSASLSANV